MSAAPPPTSLPLNAPIPADELRARLDHLSAQVDYLVAKERARQELMDELWPLARLGMDAATEVFSQAEGRGWIALARSGGRVLDRLLAHTAPGELDELADSVVALKQGVKALTRPEVMAIFEEAGEVLQEADHVAPVGPAGVVRAAGDVEVQRGLGVMLELLKHVGRATREVSRRKRGAGPHAAAPVAAPVAAPLADRLPPAAVYPVAVHPALHAPGEPALPGPHTRAADAGAAFTGEGFLEEPARWTEPLGAAIAADLGLALGDAHWSVVRAARAAWAEAGQAPNVRRLSLKAGVPVKQLYALFPHAPGKTIARLAGIPKPAGCM